MLTAQEMWPALTHDADERKAYNKSEGKTHYLISI